MKVQRKKKVKKSTSSIYTFNNIQPHTQAICSSPLFPFLFFLSNTKSLILSLHVFLYNLTATLISIHIYLYIYIQGPPNTFFFNNVKNKLLSIISDYVVNPTTSFVFFDLVTGSSPCRDHYQVLWQVLLLQGPPSNFVFLENALKKTTEYFIKILFLFESTVLPFNNGK